MRFANAEQYDYLLLITPALGIHARSAFREIILLKYLPINSMNCSLSRKQILVFLGGN